MNMHRPNAVLAISLATLWLGAPDSGAPIFSGTLAQGSHVNFQSDTGWGVFSEAQYINLSLGLTMCFTVGC